MFGSAIFNSKRTNYQVSSSSDTYSRTGSTLFGDVDNLSIAITVSGHRPVFVGLQTDGASVADGGVYVAGTSNFGSGEIEFTRGVAGVFTTLGGQLVWIDPDATPVVYYPALYTWDFPAQGTYTYKMRARVTNAAYTISVARYRLVVIELI